MPTIAVNINLSSIGIDAGPFTVSDNVSGVLATGVPRTSLLANYVVNADTTATQIIVTSTGVCTTTITIPIDFRPCGDTPPPPPPPPPPTPPTPPPPPEDCKEFAVINVTDTGYIKYYNCTTEETEYQFISSLGNVTLTNCLNPSTIIPGFPLADIASFTVVSNGVACGSPPPPPTPPPPTPPTPPPPTPPSDCLCFCVTYYPIDLPSDLYVRYAVCGTASVETELISALETMDNGDGTYTACICVKQGNPGYSSPVCVQGGLESLCPVGIGWVFGSSCTDSSTCFL
jgi:hypothetical protein